MKTINGEMKKNLKEKKKKRFKAKLLQMTFFESDVDSMKNLLN